MVTAKCVVSIQQPIEEATLLAMHQHMVQQNAFAQIPDAVKAVSIIISLQG